MKQVMRFKGYGIHLAAVTSSVEFMRNPLDCYTVNTRGCLNVSDAAARSGCKRFVYGSSAAVYLDGCSEDTVIDLRKHGNHYAKTKIMKEMVAKSCEHIYEMSTTGVGYFGVYGVTRNYLSGTNRESPLRRPSNISSAPLRRRASNRGWRWDLLSPRKGCETKSVPGRGVLAGPGDVPWSPVELVTQAISR